MSNKKSRVKKLIKEQRRARRRAIRDPEPEQPDRERREQPDRERQDQERQRREDQTAASVAEDPAVQSVITAGAVDETPAVETSRPKRTGRDRRRGARSADAADSGPERPDSAEHASASTRRRGANARRAAVVVTAGVLAATVASAAMDGFMESPTEAADSGISAVPGALAALGTASVAAPQTGQTFICPPLPGQPDSLTTDGQLEYRDRDSSAGSRFSAVLFATDLSGSFPESWWAQLNQDGRVNDSAVTDASFTDPESSAETADDAADPAGGPLSQREAVHESALDITRPPLLETAATADGSVPAAAALYEYEAQDGAVTGLAVGQCTAPERSQWFFGPEIAAGGTSLLTLANPFGRSATVEVSSVDSDGDRGTSGTRSIVVPGQTTRTVNVAGLASAGSDLGVRVRSAGAPVTAQLQSSRAAGLTGTGVEFLPRMTTPATEHLMPGVPVPEGVPDSADDDDEDSTAPPELWIHVPGERGATVELQVFGEDGQQVIETPGVFTVNGGEIDAVNLRGLAAGVTDIRVRTDVPAYVSVRSETEDGADFSWAASSTALREGSGSLLPELGETELHLFSSRTASSIAYRVMSGAGEFGPEQRIELAADDAGVISAEDLAEAAPQDGEDDAAVIVFDDPQLDGEGTLHATMVTTDDDRFSLTPVSPLRGAQESVPVRLLR